MKNRGDFLTANSKLMVIVRSTIKNQELCSNLVNKLEMEEPKSGSYVELALKQDLQSKLIQGELEKCTCYIPALKSEVDSVNTAATNISEAYEPHRKTHTKDVFRDVYFQDKSGKWKSLEKRREELLPGFSSTKNLRTVTTRLNQKIGKQDEFNKILDFLNASREAAEILADLELNENGSKDVQVQKIINTLVGVGRLKKALGVWNKNKTNQNESFWQNFLMENSFILSQVFSFPAIILQSQVFVGGQGIAPSGGKISDFLVANKFTRNVVLIELKTPATKLLEKSEYRKRVYSFSRDITGSVTQVWRVI